MLSKSELLKLLDRSEADQRLILTPLLDEHQIGAGSIDLRLGFTFILSRRANISSLDPMQSPMDNVKEKYQEQLTLSQGKAIYLHPGEFLLGASLEYLCLPNDVGAYVTSRSSWGRSGLVIATATSVAPRFRGVITLELSNLGTVPVALRPGVRIAQIVFHYTDGTAEYDGRYSCPTLPATGRIYQDSDLDFWRSSPP
jgi:dCTP deaminase